MKDIEQLAARLRALIAEWGPDAARAVFEKQSAALPADQRERLALLAFGAGSQIGDVGVGDVAGNDVRTGTEGRTEVSGTVYGAAVGVNLGSITIASGGSSPSPAGGASGQASPEQVAAQRERLKTHRATLDTLLTQQAIFGSAYAPPAVAHGIREARAGIAACKAALRGWGVAVADSPDDA